MYPLSALISLMFENTPIYIIINIIKLNNPLMLIFNKHISKFITRRTSLLNVWSASVELDVVWQCYKFISQSMAERDLINIFYCWNKDNREKDVLWEYRPSRVNLCTNYGKTCCELNKIYKVSSAEDRLWISVNRRGGCWFQCSLSQCANVPMCPRFF